MTSTPSDPVVDFLRWTSGESLLQRAQSEFVSFQAQALALHLAQLEDIDPALARNAKDLVERLPATNFFRVLLAPELTARLRSMASSRVTDTGRMLVRGLDAEMACLGRGVHVSEPTWTVLGDTVVYPSGEVRVPVRIAGLPPIDVESPQACSIDPVAGKCSAYARRAPMPEMQRRIVSDLLA